MVLVQRQEIDDGVEQSSTIEPMFYLSRCVARGFNEWNCIQTVWVIYWTLAKVPLLLNSNRFDWLNRKVKIYVRSQQYGQLHFVQIPSTRTQNHRTAVIANAKCVCVRERKSSVLPK